MRAIRLCVGGGLSEWWPLLSNRIEVHLLWLYARTTDRLVHALRSDSDFQVWNCIFCCRHTPSINTNVRERTNNKRFSLPNTKTNGNKKFVHKTEEKKVKFKSSESKCARGTIRKFNLLIMIKYTKYNRTRIVLFFRVQSSSLVVACGARPLAADAQCSSSWSFLYRFFCNFFSPFIRAHIIKLFHSNIFSFASTFSSEMPCNRRILINLFQTVFDFDGHEKKKQQQWTQEMPVREGSIRPSFFSVALAGNVGYRIRHKIFWITMSNVCVQIERRTTQSFSMFFSAALAYAADCQYFIFE